MLPVPDPIPKVSASASMDADAIGDGSSNPGEDKGDRASGSGAPDDQVKVDIAEQ